MANKQKKSTRVRSAITGRFVDKNVSPETQEARKTTTVTETVKPYGKRNKKPLEKESEGPLTLHNQKVQQQEPTGESQIQEETQKETYPTMTDLTNPKEEAYTPLSGIKNPNQDNN